MGRAGRRLPQQGALLQGRRRGRRAGPEEAEPKPLDLGLEAAAPTGTGLVSDGGGGAEPGDGSPPFSGAPLWSALEEEGLVQRCVPVQCRPATDEELLLVHSPSFVAQLEPPESPPRAPPVGRGPRGAVGAVLALLEALLGGGLRNGVALLSPPSPEDPPDPPQAVAVAARAAQKHLGVQRVLIVDWTPRPNRPLPHLFQDDPSVLYFGVRQGRDPPPEPGREPGGGHRVELHWEQAGVSDGDYAAAAFHLLLPLAFQFQPQLVLMEATLGDHPGSVGVSPQGLSLLTHLLSALAGGRLLGVLQGGPDLGASLGGVGAVLRTLLGDPRDPPGPIAPTPSGLASIARTLSVQQRFWSCLRSLELEEEEEDEEQDEEEEEEPEPEVGEEEEQEEEEEEKEPEGDGAPPEPPLGIPPETPPGPRVGLVYDPRMEEHRNTWDSQHPESPQRLPRVLQRLQELGLAQRCLRVPPRPAPPRALRAVHTRAHVQTLSQTPSLRPRELRALSQRYNSLYLCPQSYPCARLAAGGACEAVSAVIRGQVRSALAVLRPPGHHARRGSAGGFCLFNNVGVAARHAQRLAGTPLRVLIVDWDVHHGNGTQEIFEDDPSVLYVSLHRHDGSFFPGGSGGSPRRRGRGPGTGFTLNVGWGGPRVGDPEYLLAMTRLVLPVACQFAPELVLVSAGFDAGRGDPLGGCLVSPQTFGLMTHLLGALAGGRLVLVLEGGYNLGVTAEGVGQCLGVLLGDPPTLPPPGDPQPTALRALGRTLRAHRGSWSCLRLPRVEPLPAPPKVEEGADDVTPAADDVTPAADDVTEATIGRLGALQLQDPPGGGAEAEGAGPPQDPAPVGGAEAGAGAAPCWGEDEELEEGALFAVTPLPECPHLGAVAPPPPPGGVLGGSRPPPCGVCGSRRENWLCLSCYQVLCGRYVGGHMLEHGGVSGHPLVLSLRDLAAWCYPCGGYVMNQVLLPAKTLIYRLKFGTDPPTPSF